MLNNNYKEELKNKVNSFKNDIKYSRISLKDLQNRLNLLNNLKEFEYPLFILWENFVFELDNNKYRIEKMFGTWGEEEEYEVIDTNFDQKYFNPNTIIKSNKKDFKKIEKDFNEYKKDLIVKINKYKDYIKKIKNENYLLFKNLINKSKQEDSYIKKITSINIELSNYLEEKFKNLSEISIEEILDIAEGKIEKITDFLIRTEGNKNEKKEFFIQFKHFQDKKVSNFNLKVNNVDEFLNKNNNSTSFGYQYKNNRFRVEYYNASNNNFHLSFRNIA